jgi:secretion/DNA translocation related TadE-like protein
MTTRERGSASVWLVGIVVVLVAMAGAIGVVGQATILDARLQADVDRAALAGADVLIGVVAGIPCEHATELLMHEGFEVLSCSLDSRSVRVEAGASYAGFDWSRRARAGVRESGHE